MSGFLINLRRLIAGTSYVRHMNCRQNSRSSGL